MINTVEKVYLINDDGLNIGFANQYKVVYENGITSFVPHDEANTDYQAIQEWAAIEGNNIIDPGA
jgi:hypothetical protein